MDGVLTQTVRHSECNGYRLPDSKYRSENDGGIVIVFGVESNEPFRRRSEDDRDQSYSQEEPSDNIDGSAVAVCRSHSHPGRRLVNYGRLSVVRFWFDAGFQVGP